MLRQSVFKPDTFATLKDLYYLLAYYNFGRIQRIHGYNNKVLRTSMFPFIKESLATCLWVKLNICKSAISFLLYAPQYISFFVLSKILPYSLLESTFEKITA